MVGQPALPLQLGFRRRDAERQMMHATDAPMPARRMRPLEKCDNRAGSPELIAKIQMVRARIIEVDRAFDEMQSQHVTIEAHRACCVLRHQRYVMKASCSHKSSAQESLTSKITPPKRPALGGAGRWYGYSGLFAPGSTDSAARPSVRSSPIAHSFSASS